MQATQKLLRWKLASKFEGLLYGHGIRLVIRGLRVLNLVSSLGNPRPQVGNRNNKFPANEPIMTKIVTWRALTY